MTTAGTDTVTVVIVDDQELFRAAARTVVGVTRGFSVLGEAGTGEQAVTLVLDAEPDVVLMDINLPGIDGLAATRAIVQGWQGARVLLMSTYRLEDLPSDARLCGASAYVHKEDLSPAVLRAFAEGSYTGGL